MTATTVGWLVGGLEGAVGGAALAPVLRHSALDIVARVISQRESMRLGAALASAADLARKYEVAGKRPREDGFFRKAPKSGRSSADEITEAVLTAAQGQYEERKVRHVGCMMTVIAYHSEIGASAANWLIRTADALTWNQFVLLSLVGSEDAGVRALLPDRKYGHRGSQSWGSWALENEFADLGYAQRELIGAVVAEDKPEPDGAKVKLPVRDLRFREQRLRGGGVLVHHSLMLSDIDRVTQLAVADQLSP